MYPKIESDFSEVIFREKTTEGEDLKKKLQT